ncbi:RimK family alpha-L-glutamate ligase [Streptomyces sp. NBC_00083]|uniref:ATP-grasp domain-containing protein n=1 Tax=Streptomyces sp. NBC_00083 TaxID=2975647 RepID=UPI0022583364|nr:alpha-L-glutamate ligase [Streptomyces sp. NBC_00083]MCX5384220.1 alpha-L-glutamate ligase [Streptomyces sp. NBC_00083]
MGNARTVGFITPEPDHPLLAAARELLEREHRVVTLHPETADPAQSGPVADVYLLKSRTPRALALARALESRGVPVINSAEATELCQDRTFMAELAGEAGLPFSATRTFGSLTALVEGAAPAFSGVPGGPLVVKSRHSRRHDLVTRVDSPARLAELAGVWGDEPVVVQEFAENSGYDHKLWVIDGTVFAALRRSELAPEGLGGTRSLALAELPPGWAELAVSVGAVFRLDVYGVDVIDTGGGTPLIVDINAFPGIRGQAGAPEALAALALRRAREAVAAV